MLVGPNSSETTSVLQHMRNHGGQVFHADQIRGVLIAVASASEDVDRIVIMVDGREGDPVQVAYALRFDAALSRVPLILVCGSEIKVSSAERQMFATAIPAFAEKRVLMSALRLVDNLEDVSNVEKPKSPYGTNNQPPSAKRYKILIAERSASNRLVLARQLEAAGHVCWAVEDGEQVAASFADDNFDLVMMDTEVSKMNCFDATQLIRFISAEAYKMPVVGIADHITPGLKQRSIDAGMTALLSRPVTAAHIKELLEDHLPATRLLKDSVEGQDPTVEAISVHPRFRADKGPPLRSPNLSHLGIGFDQNLLDEVRLAFQEDAQAALVNLRRAVKESNIEDYHSQLQAIRSASVTLGASHLEQLCNQGREYSAASLGMQGRVLLHKIEDEFSRVDMMLRDA